MRNTPLWDPCVAHQAKEAHDFLLSFFADSCRRVLLVAGAGFDPRSAGACTTLSSVAGPRIVGVFLREERPNPDPFLVERAEQHLAAMEAAVGKSEQLRVDIFASDGAVVGGRAAVSAIGRMSLDGITDVVVDRSALSVGVGYPLVRYFFETLRHRVAGPNLHVVVTDHPITDNAIRVTASDTAGTIYGFKGGFGLDKNARNVRLWLPQLVSGKGAVLDLLSAYVRPDEVCPILPFPAIDPRLPDRLIEEFRAEFESAWEVDARNLVYAHQRNPLDLYRTILRIDDGRQRVFADVGGSMLILSPLGNKALAVGALMAAMERDFPMAYVEAISYTVDWEKLALRREQESELVHIWLTGEAYRRPTTRTDECM